MNYDTKIETKNFTIKVNNEKEYGYFEHHEYGEECGGGLWFENRELIDADGTYALPIEVGRALNESGYKVAISIYC